MMNTLKNYYLKYKMIIKILVKIKKLIGKIIKDYFPKYIIAWYNNCDNLILFYFLKRSFKNFDFKMSTIIVPFTNEFGVYVGDQHCYYDFNGLMVGSEFFPNVVVYFNNEITNYCSDTVDSGFYPNQCDFTCEEYAYNQEYENSNDQLDNLNYSSDPKEFSTHEEFINGNIESVSEEEVLSQEFESLPTEISVEEAVFAAITEQDGLSSHVEGLISSLPKDEFTSFAMTLRILALVCDKSQTNNKLGYEKLSFKNHKLFTSVLWEPILNNSKVISTDIKDETLFNLVKSLLVRIWGDKAPVNLVHFVSNKSRNNHGKLYPKKK